jgi:Na+-driven multidrug efflux pump
MSYAYVIWIFAGLITTALYNLLSNMIRALGDSKTPLYFLIIACVINIVLDIVLILCFGMGPEGAGIATVIAQLVSGLCCAVYIVKKQPLLHFCPQDFAFDKELVMLLLKTGVPMAFLNMVISVGGIITTFVYNGLSTLAVAAYTAANKLEQFVIQPFLSIGSAAAVYVAQNYGARLFDRVKKGVKVSLLLVTITALLTFTFMMLARNLLCSLFINANEVGGNEALFIAVRYLTTMLCSILILYFLHVFRNTLQAMQISFWPMISGIAEFVCRVFMAKVAINWAFLGADALFVSEPVAWLGALLSVMLPYFFYRKRLK